MMLVIIANQAARHGNENKNFIPSTVISIKLIAGAFNCRSSVIKDDLVSDLPQLLGKLPALIKNTVPSVHSAFVIEDGHF